MRSLDDAQYEFVTDMWKRSKSSLWESVARVVDILAAAGLIYVAYDAVDLLPTILASLGAVHLLFKKNIQAFLGSVTGAIDYVKDIDVAKDAAIQMNNMIADINNKKFEDLANKINEKETETK